MFLTSYLVACFGLAASNHYEWDNYHWGQPPVQHQQSPQNGPVNDYLHNQQNQQDQVQYQQNLPSGQYPQAQDDQFQGYPPSHPVVQPLLPSRTTALPSTTTKVTPVPNSVPLEMPKHRTLLRQLYRQVLGQNFTSPGVQQLAFLSSPPSLPLSSQVRDYPQPLPAESQYDLPQYIEPPPPPSQLNDQFNYYS